jgi:hypothetical protein
MARATSAVGALMLVVGLLAAGWGIMLVSTVDREFEPRGSVGVVLLVLGAAAAFVGLYAVLRRSRG